MEKITYVDALNVALTLLTPNDKYQNPQWCEGMKIIRETFSGQEVIDKLTALRDQTAKRNSADRKPTKAQVQNIELSEVVAEVLTASPDPLTITEIMQRDDRLAGLSNQKVTAVVRSMGARIEKVADKRVNRFKLA